MSAHLNSHIYNRFSPEANLFYPCFKSDEVEDALSTMAKQLGFYRVYEVDLPAVYTFEYEDLRLVVMSTPRLFYSDRMCYALSGVLIKSDEWATEIEPLGGQEEEDVSVWRNHPKDFFQDLLDAVALLRPDMCLPFGNQKLLGPATVKALPPAKNAVPRLKCIEWQG